MSGYEDPAAVFLAGDSNVKVDPNDPAFDLSPHSEDRLDDEGLPAIYLFSNARSGDGVAYAIAEDGTILGSHWCSHWGYMRHDLHDTPNRKKACEEHYPDGYRLVVLGAGELPPQEVIDRNQAQGREAQ